MVSAAAAAATDWLLASSQQLDLLKGCCTWARVCSWPPVATAGMSSSILSDKILRSKTTCLGVVRSHIALRLARAVRRYNFELVRGRRLETLSSYLTLPRFHRDRLDALCVPSLHHHVLEHEPASSTQQRRLAIRAALAPDICAGLLVRHALALRHRDCDFRLRRLFETGLVRLCRHG